MQRVEKISEATKSLQSIPRAVRKVVLRLGGVYALPNGKEVVAGVGREGHYFLYHPLVWRIGAWIVSMPIEYEIDAQGLIITCSGEASSWRFEDLIDTGRSLQRL